MIGNRTVKFYEVNYIYINTHCTYKLFFLNMYMGLCEQYAVSDRFSDAQFGDVNDS